MKKFLLLLLAVFVFQVTSENNFGSKMQIVPEFSVTNLTLYLIKNGCKHVDIVIRQSVLETFYFQSDICKDQRNYFGMKKPVIRQTTAIGEKRNHAVYKNWQKSADDYILWQKAYAPKDRQQYLKFLQLCYAEDSLYIWKINRFKFITEKGQIKITLKS